MLCRKVLPLLSQYFDEVLDPESTEQITRHLSRCPDCRKEYDSIALLHSKLSSIPKNAAPECLCRLVEIGINNLSCDAWQVRLRKQVRRAWFKICTIESRWYATRALGTIAASAFFFLITYSLTPLYVSEDVAKSSRDSFSTHYGQRAEASALGKLGTTRSKPAKSYQTWRRPAINDLYLLNYGNSVPRTGQDDHFSVVTVVDPSGSAKIQNVLEYPTDQNLLLSFADMINSARCRPGSRNGEPVSSYLVLMFSKVSVYD